VSRFLEEKVLNNKVTQKTLKQLTAFYKEMTLLDATWALDNVTRFYAHFMHDKLEKRFMQRYNVKRTSSGFLCARRLLGKRCTQHYPKGHCPGHMPPTADHVDLWVRDKKVVLMSWHPYGLEQDSVKALVSYCEEFGFEFSVEQGPSFYFPGVTPQILMWKKGCDPRYTQ